MMMVMTTRGDVKKRCEHNGQIGEISQHPLPPTVLLGTHLDDLLLSYSDHVGQSWRTTKSRRRVVDGTPKVEIVDCTLHYEVEQVEQPPNI